MKMNLALRTFIYCVELQKFSLRKFDDAREEFEKALEVNPNSSEACLGLGKYFLANGLDENDKKNV